MSNKPINVYSTTQLKNSTNEAIPKVLTKLGYNRSHSIEDTKLIIGYSAVAISGITFVAEKKFGFFEIYPLIFTAVAFFFVLYGAFLYWAYVIEAGLVFEGSKANQRLQVRTSIEDHKPTLKVTVILYDGSKLKAEKKSSADFSQWFTQDGYLLHDNLEAYITSCLPKD